MGGGAVFLTNSDLVLANTTFHENVAGADNGGGILAENNCNMDITNCLFANNSAPNRGSGGAIYASSKMKLDVQNGTFLSNYADGQGSAIMLDRNSSLLLKDSRFSLNYNYAYGAALSVDRNCTVIAYSSIFERNRAQTGGCITIMISEAFLINCTLNNNVASSGGGAVWMSNVKLSIANTFLTNNSAPKGKDIFIDKFLGRHQTKSKHSELLTYETIFKDQNVTVSTRDNNFKQEALENNVIFLRHTDVAIHETPYASGIHLFINLGCLSLKPMSSDHPVCNSHTITLQLNTRSTPTPPFLNLVFRQMLLINHLHHCKLHH